MGNALCSCLYSGNNGLTAEEELAAEQSRKGKRRKQQQSSVESSSSSKTPILSSSSPSSSPSPSTSLPHSQLLPHQTISSSASGSTDATGLKRRTGKSSLTEALRRSSLLHFQDQLESLVGAPNDLIIPTTIVNDSSDTSISAASSVYIPTLNAYQNITTATIAPAPSSEVIVEPSSSSSSQRDIKILLLGTGDSGKSTIMKQMRILHKGGFSMDERMRYRMDIYRNVIESMHQIIIAARELKLKITTSNSGSSGSDNDGMIGGGEEDVEISTKTTLYMDFIAQFMETTDPITLSEWDGMPNSVLEALTFLWVQSGIQSIYPQLMHVSYVIDSAPYFLDELDRIGAVGYVPTDADIVRARTTTTGITEVTFRSRFFNIRMIDVGGQRSERDRKWIQCFENVTCVIFCVSLNEYDQVLLEETMTNRMLESFQLFEDVVNSQWFLNSSIVLFLNKTDLFCRKIGDVPLQDYFEDYKGPPQSFEQAAEFLRDKFLSLNQFRLQIYPYLTCATDTDNINMVFQAVEETVLANALRDTGIF